jgi:DNA mismatch endonuclease (patch repair protein)
MQRTLRTRRGNYRAGLLHAGHDEGDVRNRLLPVAQHRFRAFASSSANNHIRSKNTLPEVRTRSSVHALGIRYRLHVADLPDKPDLANKARRWAIFVHGCFWHSHERCRLASKPRSNSGYWLEKLAQNRKRDALHNQALRDLGFDVLTIWECDTRDDARLHRILGSFFADLRP